MEELIARMMAAEQANDNEDESPATIERQKIALAGRKGLKMIQRAASSKVKIGPEARIKLLEQGHAIGQRFQPPNWGNDTDRPKHLAALKAQIDACRAVQNATDLEQVSAIVRTSWDPIGEYSPYVTEKKAAGVFKKVCQARFWSLAVAAQDTK